jgi:phosphoglycolate phosphatase-like HAD superfamily hydrolase
MLLNAAGLRDFFALVDTFASRSYRKPSPNLLRTHLTDFSVNPPEAVYVGDSIGDMRMAKGAMALAWGAGWGMTRATDLIHAGADKVLVTMRELPELVK